MAKHLKITDAIQGTVSLAKSKRNYFKTKDSSSPSGHSLLAQIEMTHSGIVTRNYGFYLPARMKGGASSFTKDYAKPVIIGHDEVTDTKPVGRVINAEYIDTSEIYKNQDKYLASLFQFQDASRDKDSVLDFVNHVIREYDAKDTYKGLGHLRGTLKITDAEAIEAILDERYLTVSTSMISDSATCNICGTDWVKEGLCEHSRGQVYDDNVCVVVPGSMAYDHLGIVNTPADPHAHDFKIISDVPGETVPTIYQIANSTKEDLYKTHDGYQVAAHLFGCKDSTLVPLSSEDNIDLIEVKNNIQKMENSMKLDKTTSIEERVKDALDVKVEVYRYGEKEHGSKEVTVREYMETLDTEALKEMVAQVAKMVKASDSADVKDLEINDAINRYLDENNFELVQVQDDPTQDDPAQTDDKVEGFHGEVIYDDQVVHKGAEDAVYEGPSKKKRKKKKAKKMSDSLKLEAGEEITVEMITAEIAEITKVEDSKLDAEEAVQLAELISLYKNEDALVLNSFNWSDKSYEDMVKEFSDWKDGLVDLTKAEGTEIYEEMRKHLEEDSALSEEALGELKTSDFCGMKGAFPVIDEAHAKAALKVLGASSAADSVKGRILTSIHKKAKRLGLDLTDSFDSTKEPCNNNDSISVEDAVKAYEDAKAVLVDLGVEVPGLESADTSDKDQEIEILESQLEAANEELDSLAEENAGLKLRLGEELATRTVDMKILSGNFEITDRVEEINTHKERTLDSLEDTLKDLEAQVKVQDFVQNDGLAGDPKTNIEDPTLSQDDVTPSKTDDKAAKTEEDKYKLYDNYNRLIARYGKLEADRWLKKVQTKNGNIPTID